jgi:dTDP-4-amino-4,6-dideoxygalactose transaminase
MAACCHDDVELADRIAAIPSRLEGALHQRPGRRERRLDEVQAAILRVRLAHLDAGNARRGEIAARYDEALANGSYAPPVRRADAGHVFHQYVLRVPDRAALMARLRAEGVATAIHYPAPVHLQPAYRGRTPLGPAGCAETARAAGEVMSLPMFPELTEAQVGHVCRVLRAL